MDPTVTPHLRGDQFAFLADLVARNSGIILEEDKRYLLESRLGRMARTEGFAGLGDMVDQLRQRPSRNLVDEIVDLMTTNETSFFRDRHPFTLFEEVLVPEFLELRRTHQTLRIWSAACSTGQEAYSLAMILRERFPFLLTWDLVLLATDLSPTVLAQAREGRYKAFEIDRGVPADLREACLVRDGEDWRITPKIRSFVTFAAQNLLEPFRDRGPFDLVFLRNVMIYFDDDTRRRILTKMRHVMADDGVLVLGSTEAVPDGVSGFTRRGHPRVSCYACC